jgi:hypothetical protein
MSGQGKLGNNIRKQEVAYGWQDFNSTFMQLAREEQGRAEVITNGAVLQGMDRVLRVHGDYRSTRDRQISTTRDASVNLWAWTSRQKPSPKSKRRRTKPWR